MAFRRADSGNHPAHLGDPLLRLIALVGHVVARGSGASRCRSSAYGVSILVLATAVGVFKNVLSGH